MPKRDRMLGSVQLVILFLVSEKEDTRGETLQPLVQAMVCHPVSTAQVYTALRRMVKRGLLTTQPIRTPGTRGKPRNKHVLTTAGTESLQVYQNIAQQITAKNPS